ncbi:MAG: Uma2 family endonuclease [Cyanobacteriota bacterium]|nr:Uma2 family endonuclease [Cyanobacteriota bacterium]
MTVATETMSLEAFFAYDDGTDTQYELENGELLTMPPESYLNQKIAIALLIYFTQMGIPSEYLLMKTEIVVAGTKPTVRVPDLLVLSEVGAQALEGATRSTITLEMPPPRLVVEVVSPGTESIKRDYRYKKSQYEARGIDEYWIVDPIKQQVTVLVRVEGLYESQVLTGEQTINSPFLQELQVDVGFTATQVLSGKI